MIARAGRRKRKLVKVKGGRNLRNCIITLYVKCIQNDSRIYIDSQEQVSCFSGLPRETQKNIRAFSGNRESLRKAKFRFFVSFISGQAF